MQPHHAEPPAAGSAVDALIARMEAQLGELVDRGDQRHYFHGTSGMSRLDRLMAPANRFATKRFLKEARAKVWANTTVLARARRAARPRRPRLRRTAGNPYGGQRCLKV